MNIWAELGVEYSQELTLKDLKRAYAKRLKVTRPDRDPEGFQRLRQAYEQAQEAVESQAYQVEEGEGVVVPFSAGKSPSLDPLSAPEREPLLEEQSVPESSPVSESPKPAELPPLQRMMEKVAHQLEWEVAGHPWMKTLAEVEQYLLSNPSAYAEWSPVMRDFYRRFPILLSPSSDIPRYLPSDEVLVGELQSERYDVVFALTEYAVKADDYALQMQLSQLIIDHQDLLYSPVLARVAHALCLALAIANVSQAQKIGEVAYAWVNVSQHDELMIDEAVDFSYLTNMLEGDPRKLWSDILNQRVTAQEIEESEVLTYYFRGFLNQIASRGELHHFVQRCTSHDIGQLMNVYQPTPEPVPGVKLFNDHFKPSHLAPPHRGFDPHKSHLRKLLNWMGLVVCLLGIIFFFDLCLRDHAEAEPTMRPPSDFQTSVEVKKEPEDQVVTMESVPTSESTEPEAKAQERADQGTLKFNVVLLIAVVVVFLKRGWRSGVTFLFLITAVALVSLVTETAWAENLSCILIIPLTMLFKNVLKMISYKRS